MVEEVRDAVWGGGNAVQCQPVYDSGNDKRNARCRRGRVRTECTEKLGRDASKCGVSRRPDTIFSELVEAGFE